MSYDQNQNNVQPPYAINYQDQLVNTQQSVVYPYQFNYGKQQLPQQLSLQQPSHHLQQLQQQLQQQQQPHAQPQLQLQQYLAHDQSQHALQNPYQGQLPTTTFHNPQIIPSSISSHQQGQYPHQYQQQSQAPQLSQAGGSVLSPHGTTTDQHRYYGYQQKFGRHKQLPLQQQLQQQPPQQHYQQALQQLPPLTQLHVYDTTSSTGTLTSPATTTPSTATITPNNVYYNKGPYYSGQQPPVYQQQVRAPPAQPHAPHIIPIHHHQGLQHGAYHQLGMLAGAPKVPTPSTDNHGFGGQGPSQLSRLSSSGSMEVTPHDSDNLPHSLTSQELVKQIQEVLPHPPLVSSEVRPDSYSRSNQRRAKRKSKFTKKQDEMIVALKREGKTWVEIAEITGVGSYLAARNRYQVIVGQQGNNNSSSFSVDDKNLLKNLLDIAELEKWRFIAVELDKATSKDFTDKECRDMIKQLYMSNPESFGITEETLHECIKEKKITEKIISSCNASTSDRESTYNDVIEKSSGASNAANVSTTTIASSSVSKDSSDNKPEAIGNNRSLLETQFKPPMDSYKGYYQ